MSPSNVHYFWPIKCYICCTPTIYKAGPSHYVTWNMDVDHFLKKKRKKMDTLEGCKPIYCNDLSDHGNGTLQVGAIEDVLEGF